MAILERIGQDSGVEDRGSQLFDSLSGHFGNEVVSYDAQIYTLWRRDESGEFRKKVGGALIVRCLVAIDSHLESREVKIDDTIRPFPEEVITALGAEAEAAVHMERLLCS